MKNPIFYKRSKHIETKFYYIHELVKKVKEIIPEFCFMKPSHRHAFYDVNQSENITQVEEID